MNGRSTKYLTQEIRAYRRLEGFDNAPKFWGFVTEHDRTIGFLIEYIEGARFTKRSDEAACADAVARMHEETGLIPPTLYYGEHARDSGGQGRHHRF